MILQIIIFNISILYKYIITLDMSLFEWYEKKCEREDC